MAAACNCAGSNLAEVLDGNLGLISAAGSAFLILYTAALMVTRRKRSSEMNIILKGKIITRMHTGVKILNLSKNSHFKILFFDKIHIFKFSFLTKFTF